LKNDDTTKHVIGISPEDESQVIEVWVRDISFLDIQAAAQKMLRVEKGDVTLDLAGYWEHAFSHWITKTNPSLTTDELLSLKGHVGEQVCKVLPQPQELAEALQGGFTNPTE
jgi:hypothetical protein|tara:strand:+ start:2687 stop:3022 length:336 start_codon:yes stop_codon:yes gene_type:complete